MRAELDAADVMSVTAYRRSTWDYRADAIQFGLPFADFIGVTNEVIGSFTQEFRAASNNDPTEMGWTAGLLFARTKMDYEAGFLFNNGAPAGPPAIAETVARDVGVYGGVSVPLNSLVTVQGGLRYDWAGREGTNEFAPPAISRGDEEFGEVLPSVSLVYSANDSVSYFAKYARAFKPGGFNVRTFATDPFSFEYGEETSDNVEVGFRALGLSGKFALSGAFFYSKFHDFQDLTQLSPTTFGISNADSARSFGAELDAAYMLMPSLKLFGTFGYTNAQYESYDSVLGDFSGNTISFTPEFTATYGLEYQGSSGLYGIARARTTGPYYLDDANTAEQDAYTLVDLVAGYRWGRFDASFFVHNLTDQRYVTNAFGTAGPELVDIGTIGDPRTYGARAKVVF